MLLTFNVAQPSLFLMPMYDLFFIGAAIFIVVAVLLSVVLVRRVSKKREEMSIPDAAGSAMPDQQLQEHHMRQQLQDEVTRLHLQQQELQRNIEQIQRQHAEGSH